MPSAEQRFRHDLRNVINSLLLALRAYEISDDNYRVKLLDMMVQSADEAIALLDGYPHEQGSPPATS
jgi:uncharacterized protein (DUF2252 family)